MTGGDSFLTCNPRAGESGHPLGIPDAVTGPKLHESQSVSYVQDLYDLVDSERVRILLTSYSSHSSSTGFRRLGAPPLNINGP